jgi:alpha-ribazole phosphatase
VLSLLLVRHGVTDWNAQRIYQGQTDVPLSDQGRKQAEQLAKRLVGQNVDAVYASDLIRAGETANIIGEKIGAEIIPEPRLREMSFGILEGLTFTEAQMRYPDVVSAWLEDYNSPPPNGETMDSFSARVSSFLDDLQKKHKDQTILLVAHGGSLNELVRLLLEVPVERRWSFAMDNASLSEMILVDDGYPLLKRLNDICHLD